VWMWIGIEVDVGIICASVPACKSLFGVWREKVHTIQSAGSRNTPSKMESGGNRSFIEKRRSVCENAPRRNQGRGYACKPEWTVENRCALRRGSGKEETRSSIWSSWETRRLWRRSRGIVFGRIGFPKGLCGPKAVRSY
jgi:hypothetical protein